MKAMGFLTVLILALSYSKACFAKRTAAEEAAKRAAQQQQKSETRIRLEAKFEPIEVAGAEVENGRELKVRYESGKKLRLDAEAENFAAGTTFDVFVGNINIGKITVVDNAGVLEGEIGFRDANWPAGLPKDLPVGTIVRFFDANAVEIASGPLNPK